MANEALRAEHDAVLASLSTRDSTHHFAHGAVSLFVSFVLGGTSVRLWLDYGSDNPEWGAIAGALGVLAFLYALVRLVLGARSYGREKKQLGRLLELRKTLGVDAPASLSSGHS
ncbi:MAG: hypothetical protein ACOZQL_24695 [Myxococcota bacterium]